MDNISLEKQQEIDSLEFLPIGRAINLTGQKYGKLTVLGRGPNYGSGGRDTIVRWWCICDCPEHNIVLVRASNLKTSKQPTRSCGCLQKEIAAKTCAEIGKLPNKYRLDLTNQRFGRLIAIRNTNDVNKKGSCIWQCKCDCGNYCEVTASRLIDGTTQSCGCLRSKGEQKISEVLRKLDIEFETQKVFNSCRFEDTNAVAYFDFYLPKYNLVIEYNGKQHYTFTNKDWNTEAKLKYTQEHDAFKKHWCEMNNIRLEVIPYTDYGKIDKNYILQLLEK